MIIGQHNYVTFAIGDYEEKFADMMQWLRTLKLPRHEQIRHLDGLGYTFHLHPFYAKQFIKKFGLDYELPEN